MSVDDISASNWQTADLVFRLLALDPGLGGAVIRMRASPARTQLLALGSNVLGLGQKVHPSVSDDQLFGGIDIGATLAMGGVQKSTGLLEKHGTRWLVMGERCPADLAAKLAMALDSDPQNPIIVLDEGAEEGETIPSSLAERLAFSIAPADRAEKLGSNKENCSENPASISDEEIAGLTEIALRFGIDSLRAPILAVRCAKAHAQLYGRNRTNEDDIAIAAALVFAHRAVVVPADEDDVSQPEPETREQDDAGGETQQNDQLFDADMIIEAVSAVVPHEVLAGLSKTAGSAKSTGSGAGSKRKGNRRGRPLPSRAGRLDGRNRLDVVATLRAAAPWQTIRRRQTPDRTGLLLRPSDFRVKRFETKSDRLLVFAVDASGSAAVARLNEAKGAIEYLLADAYASRDHVALVVFRGTSAECLLPPTRSLVQAKRRLAAMPGGGGTPLATGLKEGMELALQAEGRGLSPVLVLLTDGRGNVALDGTPNRAQAGEDATIMAKAVLRSGLQTLVVDTSARPQSALRTLAQQLDAPYVPLPRAAADALSGAIQTALPSG